MRSHEQRDDQKNLWETREHQVIDKYMGVNKLHRSILESNLNKTGVYRSQHQILVTIFCNPQASQKELARLLNVSTAAIAVSVKKLERGGYINRIVDQNDNRYNSIGLTESGRDVAKYSIQFFRNVENLIFDGFTPEELDHMENYLDRMYRNLHVLCLGSKKTERED